jgi:aminoglycoside phosphotransferase (APT) family kinase protein
MEIGLARAMRRANPAAETVTALTRLSGGASQETWAFTLNGPGLEEKLIFRRAPGGEAVVRAAAVGLEMEAAIITLAAAHNVPVPEVRLVLRPEDGLGAGFVMRRVEGETIARRILRDAAFAAIRPHLAHQCGEILAAIHAVPVPTSVGLPLKIASYRLAELEQKYYECNARRPVFELAFRWLHDHQPPPVPPQLIHGDFRNGNLMISPQGVAAVLDWEIAHLGDPAEDLAWLCVPSWRFGSAHPAGGFGSVDELLAGYSAAGGTPPDLARLRYWLLFGVLFWGMSCLGFAMEFRAGDRSVERAAIGRRTSETEFDILHILEGGF